jgi:DNA-binding transcriptional regulator YiaG
MSGDSITRAKPDLAAQPDWTEADKLTDDDIRKRALSDPDAQPWNAGQWARARRVVDVRLIRDKYGLTQDEFARRFGLKPELVRGWEDKTLTPDAAAITLLRVIWADPDAVRRVLAAE